MEKNENPEEASHCPLETLLVLQLKLLYMLLHSLSRTKLFSLWKCKRFDFCSGILEKGLQGGSRETDCVNVISTCGLALKEINTWLKKD